MLVDGSGSLVISGRTTFAASRTEARNGASCSRAEGGVGRPSKVFFFFKKREPPKMARRGFVLDSLPLVGGYLEDHVPFVGPFCQVASKEDGGSLAQIQVGPFGGPPTNAWGTKSTNTGIDSFRGKAFFWGVGLVGKW